VKVFRVSREREGAGGLFDGLTRDRRVAGVGQSLQLRDLIGELEGHWDECPGWDCGERALLSDGTRMQRAWVGIDLNRPQDSRAEL